MGLFQQVHCTVNKFIGNAGLLLAGAGCADHGASAPSTGDVPVTNAPAVNTPGNTVPGNTVPAIKAMADQVLTLSPKAAEKLRLMRVNGKLKADAVVRISVLEGNYFRLKGGGDKRYRYHLVLDDDPQGIEHDVSMESEGLTILIPKSNAEFLRGTELVWMEAGNKGGFKFHNPNQLQDDEVPQQIIPIADPKSGPTPITE